LNMPATITPRELFEQSKKGSSITLVDVRTPAEFGEVHADLAKNVPLDRLSAEAVALLRGSAGGALYVICRSGTRGKAGCEKLAAMGVEAVNVEGGTSAWEAAGLPVVRGKKAISLERQVRIAAGLLVLTGALLGYFVHPYWIGLAGFVGAGLTFAGVTDTCGMAMVLARMPWNQAPGSGTCAGPAKSA